eukprot:CAMPEP_0174276212 /NCGR_PEP_ID=MMETSP0439-20130205/60260_1 /TAXON_ID=0 /ORGANISM="Stereomyxa ramosa, Strain Chinc5" /LENGTH=144 /DNA_ID=CAMNT_0015368411 /DNA_START=597 /DNA_END=1028 /DNA_ORIENTATION=-
MVMDGEDGRDPLLLEMADSQSKYYTALSKFKQRTLYCNISSDLSVPYSTAAIQPYNPFLRGEQEIKYSTKYYPVVEYSQNDNLCFLDSKEGESEEDNTDTDFYSNDEKGHHLKSMLASLSLLTWNRVPIKFQSVFSHEMIVSKK